MFKENEILILIGAGCSAEAGIPTSVQMVDNLETLLKTEPEWREFENLYFFLRASIAYSAGIRGKFDHHIDIEQLVNVLSELEKRDNSILYPYIGSWNQRLVEIAGYDFGILKKFKKRILERLKKWVSLSNYKSSEYYKPFFDFQASYNYPLRIFSLNYDLCLEKNKPEDKEIERGFDRNTRQWDWRKYDPESLEPPNIYFYKMHGSIDWERSKEQGNILKEVDSLPEEPDLIFGTNYKMQYVDPYLFYAYEFRRYTLEAKVIITIGYSFVDEHVNGILKQALENSSERIILAVSRKADPKTIAQKLGCASNGQIATIQKTVTDLMRNFTLEEIQASITKK